MIPASSDNCLMGRVGHIFAIARALGKQQLCWDVAKPIIEDAIHAMGDFDYTIPTGQRRYYVN